MIGKGEEDKNEQGELGRASTITSNPYLTKEK